MSHGRMSSAASSSRTRPAPTAAPATAEARVDEHELVAALHEQGGQPSRELALGVEVRGNVRALDVVLVALEDEPGRDLLPPVDEDPAPEAGGLEEAARLAAVAHRASLRELAGAWCRMTPTGSSPVAAPRARARS